VQRIERLVREREPSGIGRSNEAIHLLLEFFDAKVAVLDDELEALAEPRPETAGGVRATLALGNFVDEYSLTRSVTVKAASTVGGAENSSRVMKNWPKFRPLALSVNDCPAMAVV
jgi:hypothetical protein